MPPPRRTPGAADPKESLARPGRGVAAAPRRRIIVSRYVLRRLYSTFAGGWPGIGLLLMRLVVGAVVLWHAGPRLWSGPPLHMIVAYAPLALAAVLLIAGLWTPVAGGVVAVVAISEIFTTGEPPVGRLLTATIAGALTMLGPGRLSIDARLFGWKRIEAPPRRSHSNAHRVPCLPPTSHVTRSCRCTANARRR